MKQIDDHPSWCSFVVHFSVGATQPDEQRCGCLNVLKSNFVPFVNLKRTCIIITFISSSIISMQLRAWLPGFDSRKTEVYSSSPLLEAHPASFRVYTAALSPGVMRPEHEPEDSPPCGAEGKNEWSYL